MIQDAEGKECFMVTRDGDNLTTCFQCDVCYFINMMGREPVDGLASDIRLLKCIKRVNLDAFWAPNMLKTVLDEAKRGLAIALA
jgi:hypothetical protein